MIFHDDIPEFLDIASAQLPIVSQKSTSTSTSFIMSSPCQATITGIVVSPMKLVTEKLGIFRLQLASDLTLAVKTFPKFDSTQKLLFDEAKKYEQHDKVTVHVKDVIGSSFNDQHLECILTFTNPPEKPPISGFHASRLPNPSFVVTMRIFAFENKEGHEREEETLYVHGEARLQDGQSAGFQRSSISLSIFTERNIFSRMLCKFNAGTTVIISGALESFKDDTLWLKGETLQAQYSPINPSLTSEVTTDTNPALQRSSERKKRQTSEDEKLPRTPSRSKTGREKMLTSPIAKRRKVADHELPSRPPHRQKTQEENGSKLVDIRRRR